MRYGDSCIIIFAKVLKKVVTWCQDRTCIFMEMSFNQIMDVRRLIYGESLVLTVS